MGKFSKSEIQLLKSVSDRKLKVSLASIRNSVEMIWSRTPRIIKDNTDRGIRHCENIAFYATKLLAVNKGQELTELESYLLLAGIYLHDIGMQCEIGKCRKIKNLAEGMGARFGVEFTALTADNYSYAEQKSLRANHQFVSAAWIKYAHQTGETQLGSAAQSIQGHMVQGLLYICKCHSGFQFLKCLSRVRNDAVGRKRLLAALLRFADELDKNNKHVDLQTISHFSTDDSNTVRWWLLNNTEIDFSIQNVVNIKVKLHSKDFAQFREAIYRVIIEKFREKNQEVLNVLRDNSILITIGSESEVIQDDSAEMLPEKIKNYLRDM